MPSWRTESECRSTILPPQDRSSSHRSTPATERFPLHPFLKSAHRMTSGGIRSDGDHIDIDTIRVEIGMLADGYGQIEQIQINQIFRGYSQYDVLRPRVHEGTVISVFWERLHMQVHTGLTFHPMPLVQSIHCVEPRVVESPSIEVAPPCECGPRPVAAKRLTSIRIQKNQVEIGSGSTRLEQQDSVGTYAMPAVAPTHHIIRRRPSRPGGIAQIKADEIVSCRVQLDELHIPKVHVRFVGVTNGSGDSTILF